MRLDAALAARGLVRSRSHAQQLLAAGVVAVNGNAITKASTRVSESDLLEVLAADKYVSRGAYKLLAALQQFLVNPTNKTALDVGASTGGFTQVLLEQNAKEVIALDVGHGQLVGSLRADSRVRVVEGFNAREITPQSLSKAAGTTTRPDLIVGDLSFISLTLVLPALAATLAPAGDIIMLIKPQFEVGVGGVKDGIVRDQTKRLDAVRRVLDAATAANLETQGLIKSPIVGGHGNHEYLAHWRLNAQPNQAKWYEHLEALTAE